MAMVLGFSREWFCDIIKRVRILADCERAGSSAG